MVATPVLAGALLRIIMGILVDRLSPKKAAIIGQVVVIATMLYAWQIGVHSYAEVLVLGLFLGVAGASFAAAAAGFALVSGGTSGHGDGYCRRRKLRHSAGCFVCAGSGGCLWLGQCSRYCAD